MIIQWLRFRFGFKLRLKLKLMFRQRLKFAMTAGRFSRARAAFLSTAVLVSQSLTCLQMPALAAPPPVDAEVSFQADPKAFNFAYPKPINYPDEKSRLFDWVFMGKFADVQKICSEKIAQGTAKAYHHQALAYSWMFLNQPPMPRVVHFCQRGLKEFPDDLPLQTAYTVALARNMQWPAAWRQSVKVLDIDPKNVPALTVRGLCVHRSGREEQGFAMLRRALSIDPGNQEMNMLMVFYARMRGKKDDIYTAFDRWNELNPRSAVSFYIRAEFEQDDAKYDDALRDFHKAVAINPDFGQCTYKMAKLYYNRQNWAYACKAFQRAEMLDANHENGVARLVDCLLRTKQYKEAVTVATKAIEIFKNENYRKKEALEVPGFEVLHESSLLVECQVKRAIAYFYSGDIAKATADVVAVLRAHPDNVPALDLNQKIAFKTGNYGAALVSLNKLIDIDQDVQMWYESRAEAYKKLGQLAKAEADLKVVDTLNKTGRLPN